MKRWFRREIERNVSKKGWKTSCKEPFLTYRDANDARDESYEHERFRDVEDESCWVSCNTTCGTGEVNSPKKWGHGRKGVQTIR